MAAGDERYEGSGEAASALLPLIIGLGLTLGPGALLVDSVLDLRAFPDAPRSMSVAEAASLANPPRGAWVTLTDARLDCAHPPREAIPGGRTYMFVTDESGASRVLVELEDVPEGACGEWRDFPRTGVLAANEPGRIAGLEWDGVDWQRWPTPHLATLWTSQGPSNSRSALWIGPLAMLPGLLLLVVSKEMLRGALHARRHRMKELEHVAFTMPLSTGASALTSFSLPVGVMQIVVFGPLFFATKLPEWMVYPLGVLAALWIFAVFGSLAEGWKRRASDLLLGADGFAIQGGPLHRTRFAWRDNTAKATRVEGGTLQIGGEVAARSLDDDETRSLECVAETIQGLHAQALGLQLPRPDREPPGVVHCRHCGGPAAPSESEHVRCRYCGETVDVPEAAREQLRALEATAAARAEAERLLRRLLRQPGATATNALVFLALPPLFAGWPLASFVFDELFHSRHVLGWMHGVALFAGALAFTWGLSWLVRAFISQRAAVRVVTTSFAAIPPAIPGAPCSCRECGAPLPEAPVEQLVIVCAYCRCENLTGVNILPAAGRAKRQAGTLAIELRARLADLRRYRLLALASLVLLAASVALLAPAWVRIRGG